MKQFAFVGTFLLASLGAFCYGTMVGADKMAMNQVAFRASLALEDLDQDERVLKNPEMILEDRSVRNQWMIKDSIRSYGIYLSSFSSSIPLHGSLDDFSHKALHDVIRWQLEKNPDFRQDINAFYEDQINNMSNDKDARQQVAELKKLQRQYNLALDSIHAK